MPATADRIVAVAEIVNDKVAFPVCINCIVTCVAVNRIFSFVVPNVIVARAARQRDVRNGAANRIVIRARVDCYG